VALPEPDTHTTCLVTGASSGIGAEIARELARRGHGLTLVARREERLRELADELTAEHGVHAESVGCDVTSDRDRQKLVRSIDDRGVTVEVLVNNAGFGSAGRFWELDADTEVSMVRTNCEAIVALCGTYVPRMVNRGRGAILNTASTAAFQPIPRQATYAATKAFVVSFTDALHTELSGTGVTATSLCPGPVPTEFQDVAEMGVEFDDLPGFAVMSAADTAKAAVEALEKGRRGVAPGIFNTVSAAAGRMTPRSVLLPLMDRFYPVGK
jgi:short-subunit dehydrogenase